jgi:hypothetical protein
LKIFYEGAEIKAHVWGRKLLEAGEGAAPEIVCGAGLTHALFQISGCQVDQRLKETTLLGFCSHRMPQSFQHFVAFPPVSEVVEIKGVPIIL